MCFPAVIYHNITSPENDHDGPRYNSPFYGDERTNLEKHRGGNIIVQLRAAERIVIRKQKQTSDNMEQKH